jgi:hypothetical protein
MHSQIANDDLRPSNPESVTEPMVQILFIARCSSSEEGYHPKGNKFFSLGWHGNKTKKVGMLPCQVLQEKYIIVSCIVSSLNFALIASLRIMLALLYQLAQNCLNPTTK